ncbi:MAG: hypothetical protein IT379_14870 [Deltaproteobacteria bacterium]|nr:hypothetical protein [Deltaproteobacteria bacterium]
MAQTKRVTVEIDFDEAGNPQARTRVSGGRGDVPLPEMPRRDVLSELYAALSTELERWKGANPGAKESSKTDMSAPVVWQLHQVARRVLHGEIGVPEATVGMNDVLVARVQRMGASYELLQNEVARLVVLMTASENAPLAPYNPYDEGEAGARTW